jgi:hypothetical protein
MSEFIFMLTHHDATVPNAIEVWREVEKTKLRYVGFKDVGIAHDAARRLVDAIHSTGRPVMLEVVSESRDDELRAVQSALSLGIDYLLGGTRANEVAPLIAGTSIRYFPFPGHVVGHPSKLEGTPAEIAASAHALASSEGVAGLDLLAYRNDEDPEGVAAAVIAAVDVPVVIAGSIDSIERVRRVTQLGAWGFTVGSAIFEGRFGLPGAQIADCVAAVLDAAAASEGSGG